MYDVYKDEHLLVMYEIQDYRAYCKAEADKAWKEGVYCVRCGANAVAYWSKLNSYSCGCVLLKISPDENQFEDETNKDLDKELVRV